MTSTRCSASAKAVARLTAVVVLPTPPFWLAIAMMRARRPPATARDSPSPLGLTDDLLQLKDDPPRVGATGMPRRGHSPALARRGQFFLHLFAFKEQTERVAADQVDAPRPALQQFRVGLQPFQCFT